MFKRALSSMVLAFVLLVAQQGAVWHALSHYHADLASSEPDKPLPHSEQCAKCVVYAKTGAAAAATPLVFLATPLATVCITYIGVGRKPAPDCPYQSQAPPRLA